MAGNCKHQACQVPPPFRIALARSLLARPDIRSELDGIARRVLGALDSRTIADMLEAAGLGPEPLRAILQERGMAWAEAVVQDERFALWLEALATRDAAGGDPGPA